VNKKWIDVSAHNGVIDWPKVAASGVKGAVIRAGYGNDIRQQDTKFSANIKGAIAAGLKVAIYWFSYADTPEDARKEWSVCRQIIAPYKDKILFVAYDYEYDSVSYFRKVHGTSPSNALVNQIVNAFLSAVKSDGWGTVLYTNNDYRLHVFSATTLAAWDIWLADYSGGPDIPCPIQQTSSTGSVPGISTPVDLNTFFKDYSTATFKCDTTSNMTIKHGAYYQMKVTVSDGKPPQVYAGTPDVITVLPRYVVGNDHYIYLCAVGPAGSGTGIYVNGKKQFAINVE
jgi:Lyzozyme M1 (1,4-beta-N-acetylmuramidase)